MTAYPPKTLLARLYEKTSARGTTYFRGRLGLANVVLLRSQELSENGEPVWELSAQEPATQPAAKLVQPSLFQAKLSRHRVRSDSRAALPDDIVNDLWAGRP